MHRGPLRAQFGFDCTRAACALGDDAATLRESDRRRARAGALDDEIFGQTVESPEERIETQ